MKEEKKKKERKLTPIGEAKWAHVHTPKPAFENKGAPKFQIDVVFSQDDAEWKAWASDVMEQLKKLPVQIDKRTGEEIKKQVPIKRELDESDQPTGRWYVTFKTGEQFKPPVFDRYGKVIPPETLIGNGSKVRVSYTPSEYEGFGGGINFYLNAVQVIELVEYAPKNADAYGFEIDKEPEPQTTAVDDLVDDDLPF